MRNADFQLTRKVDSVNVKMYLSEDVLQRQAFQRFQMGNLLRRFGERHVEHPRDYVLNVTPQWMANARVDMILGHASIESHMRTVEKRDAS